MLPALRLSLLTLGAVLASSAPALAAGPSISVPAEGQVAVTFASGVKSVKVKSMPNGLTVAGGVKHGKLAVAVVRPRGVTASGKVVLTVKGKAKGVKTIAAALDGGKAPNCKDLAGLLGKRLKGSADVKGLAGVLAAKLCGKAAPANTADVLSKLGLGAPSQPAKQSTPPTGVATKPTTTGSGGLVRPTPTPTATATPMPGVGGKPCANGSDDDADGQIDLDDPGCADGNDATETGEVRVSDDCLSNGSGVFMNGDDPKALFAAINRCGDFTKVRFDVAPGISGCDAMVGGAEWDCAPAGGTYAIATAKGGKPVDTMDAPLNLTGAANCGRKFTLALYRPNGEVAEINAAVGNCGPGGQPKPQCADGKDNDGDGMTDYHFLDGVTDPDAGCTADNDNDEASELLPAGDCQIEMDVLDDNPKVAAAVVQNCGVIQGFWFVTPGTPVNRECAFRLGGQGNPITECWVLRGHVGSMFDKTTQPLVAVAEMTANGDCRPMTVAVIMGDNTVVRQRMRKSGC